MLIRHEKTHLARQSNNKPENLSVYHLPPSVREVARSAGRSFKHSKTPPQSAHAGGCFPVGKTPRDAKRLVRRPSPRGLKIDT